MTEPIPGEIAKEKKADFIEHVQATYKGLRCFVNISRIESTGETIIHFFDLDQDPLDSIYVSVIHPRDLFICGLGMTLPALTHEQFIRRITTGELPPGYILANDYQPAEPAP